MPNYWLDTSVFITASQDDHAFDIEPEFWDQLEADARAGIIGAPQYVYREIVDLSGRDDDLAKWAKKLKDADLLFHEPDDAVLAAYTKIADYVHINGDPSESDKFLNDADPWVIAHAMTGATVVVSQEKMVGPGSKRIKVPNICAYFTVGYIKTNQLLRELKDLRG